MTRAVLLGAAWLILATAARADAKKELEKFQGKWQVVRIEENGVAEPEAEAKRFALSIKDTTITVELNGRTETTTFRIDPEPSPKTIDLVPQYGADKGKTFRGIYEFNGETLTICATPKAERPKKFVSEDGTLVLVLKRAQ